MPVKVIDLEKGNDKNSLRGKVLELLKKDPSLAYTLREIYSHFMQENEINNHYKNKQQILYKLIYNYLREFKLKDVITHKGNYYYYNKRNK